MTPDDKRPDPNKPPMPLAPQGSRDYVAGQPIDEAERDKVEAEAAAKRKTAEDAARKVEDAHKAEHPQTSPAPAHQTPPAPHAPTKK